MSTNSWIALSDVAVARWEATSNDLLALAATIIRAGEDTGVLRFATSAPDRTDVRPFDYRPHLRTGVVPFELAPEEVPEGRRLIMQGEVCWYENGIVREGDVADLGSLIRLLRPDAVNWADDFMAHVPPVIVWAGRSRVRIDLPTDIWFPRVLGVLDGDAPPPPFPPARDNSTLASRHTPRLNVFLNEVRRAADSWALVSPEGIAARYADMTDDHGIRV